MQEPEWETLLCSRGRFEGPSQIARNLSAMSRFLLAMPCLDRLETVVNTKYDKIRTLAPSTEYSQLKASSNLAAP